MESMQQHLYITGLVLMTLWDKSSSKMTFSESHKQPFFFSFVTSFLHSSCHFPVLGEIKMYLGGGSKLSCQWLHCLSRIAVINFAHTRGRSLG